MFWILLSCKLIEERHAEIRGETALWEQSRPWKIHRWESTPSLVGRVRCEEADEASDLERIFSLMPLGIQTQAEGLCRESADLITAALLIVGIRRGNDQLLSGCGQYILLHIVSTVGQTSHLDLQGDRIL